MKILPLTATSVLAWVILPSSSLAQTPEISVEAMRVTRTNVGQTTTGTPGIPIENVSLVYGVSTSGLDLSSQSGKKELKERVHRAALTACKELGRQFPDATPSDADCATIATNKAMAQIEKIEATVGKK
jgi:UrcA family protein